MKNNGYDTEYYTSNSDSDKEEETHNDIDFVIVLHLMLTYKYYTRYIVKEPCRTFPYVDHNFVIEILNGYHNRCHQ